MSILGLTNTSFVQEFDRKNSNFSKLKKLSSRFMPLSKTSNYLKSKYGGHLDSTLLEMCNEPYLDLQVHVCDTSNKNSEMGSKLSLVNYGVPSVHYDVKKPAVNIIGGYVGAKSQQNRESPNYFFIHEIVMQLLPDILSENCEHMTQDFLEMEAKHYMNKAMENCTQSNDRMDFGQENVNRPMEEKEGQHMCPEETKDLDALSSVSDVMPDTSNVETVPAESQDLCGGKNSITYASVVSAAPHPVPKAQQSAVAQQQGSTMINSFTTTRNSKNSRKKKRRRRKKQMKMEKNSCLSAETQNNVILVRDGHNFPSLWEEEPDASNFVSAAKPDTIDCFEIDGFEGPSAQSDYLFCSTDEVDSPHSTDLSDRRPCSSRTSSNGSSVVCHNNTIAFIINGNDELSDTDSDWSCDAVETFEDDVWESFKENFECFQNFFVMESFCPNRTTIPEKDSDCELQDDQVFLYINQVDLENGSERSMNELVASRLKEVNQRWDNAVKDVVIAEKPTKVNFAPDSHLVKVHYLERSLDEIRCESWDHYQLDRCHFRKRIEALEPLISPCFDQIHRQKVWDRLLCARVV